MQSKKTKTAGYHKSELFSSSGKALTRTSRNQNLYQSKDAFETQKPSSKIRLPHFVRRSWNQLPHFVRRSFVWIHNSAKYDTKIIDKVLLLRTVITVTVILTFSSAVAEAREQERITMVRQQIENRGIECPLTLEAMRKVPRHLFIPENVRRLAYSDRPVPIGYGQTISQPYIVAIMTELVDPQPEHKVLEIGTGSGYQAAVLAEIVDQVYTIEIVPELAEWSTDVINSIGYENIHIKTGDGYHGWEEHARFDAIIVTAAAEHIPPPLIEQLKEGGKMIIPVGSPFMTQNLMLVEKVDGSVRTTSLMPVRFVPFTRTEQE